MNALGGIILAGMLSVNVFADDASLVSNFKKANQLSKGGFGKNVVQNPNGRWAVGGASAEEMGCYKFGRAGGAQLFQTAYRNTIAQQLVDVDQFYIANRYASNYYELMGEYVFGDRCGNHPIDNVRLLEKAAEAMPKFMLMTQHHTLERYYAESNLATNIGKAAVKRGVSDSEDEIKYARDYFNFGLSAMTQDSQYLAMYILSKKSPLKISALIGKARDAIAALYEARTGGIKDYAGGGYLGELYNLRNMIHNTLSKDIIGEIEKFKRRYPEDAPELNGIQANLREYFATGARNVYDAAKKVNATGVMSAVEPMIKGAATAQSLLAVSNELAAVRANVSDETIYPTETKVDVLVLINTGAQFLAKEINVMKQIDSKDALVALLNTIYVEGFIPKNNLTFFQGQMNSAADIAAAAAVLPRVVNIASRSISTAFSPALDQWKLVDPKMDNFIDNVIKSSTLSAASTIDAKIKR